MCASVPSQSRKSGATLLPERVWIRRVLRHSRPGRLLVEGLRGDYFNVVGLPVCRLGRMLARFGVDLLAPEEKELNR